ncbi:protein phosphatase, Mg2+/Mn2+ dependent 1F [Phyllostomus discolor]|uniref:Protein phosphatase 1F n=4 Tax=Phyllostomus discolor TaxID=89673 RepID=A0A833Z0F0_9CHIR|nr:protein phosphatase, Mg2+/Mn2+ dependent 1F [Phyllostomus discolor]
MGQGPVGRAQPSLTSAAQGLFPGVAVMKDHRLGALNNRAGLSQISGGRRSKIKVSAGLVPSGGCQPPWLNAPPLLASSLAHEAVSQLLQTDLSEFRTLPRQEEDNEEVEEQKAPVTLLDTKGLAWSFFNRLWEVCSQWQKQVPSTAQVPPRQWLVSIHAIRNTRRRMEDRHVCLPAFNQLFGLSDAVDRAYFAVFDGHGGLDASRYAAVHVHANAARQPELRTDPAGALREAFRRTDEMFLGKAKRERLQSGTTGVCALIAGKTLHVAWLGDSQVILVQQGQVVKLMEPHRPERQDEKERIEALGGFVSHMDCWRVNGTLAVSRAIGDVFQKPYVSGEADAASRELTGSEDYLLLACDGFFDVVPHQEVAGLVQSHLVRQQGSGLRVAEELVAAARERGSHDNITVMVVFFRDPQDLLEGGAQGAGDSQADRRSQDVPCDLSEAENNTPWRSEEAQPPSGTRL